MHLFIHSPNEHLLNTLHVLGITLGAGKITVNEKAAALIEFSV